MTSRNAPPIAAMSAAMLSVLAMSKSPTRACSSMAGIALPRLGATPRPVTAHVRARPGAVPDQLNGDHERRGQEHRPAQRVAELGAALGIGGDAAWIVIGGAGDQAGPEHGKQRFYRPAFLSHKGSRCIASGASIRPSIIAGPVSFRA